MDRRGENLVRPLLLAVCLHIVLISTFFCRVPEAKTITPPPIIVIQPVDVRALGGRRGPCEEGKS